MVSTSDLRNSVPSYVFSNPSRHPTFSSGEKTYSTADVLQQEDIQRYNANVSQINADIAAQDKKQQQQQQQQQKQQSQNMLQSPLQQYSPLQPNFLQNQFAQNTRQAAPTYTPYVDRSPNTFISSSSVRTTTPYESPPSQSRVEAFQQPSFKQRASGVYQEIKNELSRPKGGAQDIPSPFSVFQYGSELLPRPYSKFETKRAEKGTFGAIGSDIKEGYSSGGIFGVLGSESAGYYLQSPETLQILAFGGYAAGGLLLEGAEVEYGAAKLSPRVYAGKSIQVGESTLQKSEAYIDIIQPRKAVLYESKYPGNPYQFPSIKLGLEPIKSFAYLPGTTEVNKVSYLQEFQLASGETATLTTEGKALQFTSSGGKYSSYIGDELIEQGTFNPVTQPGGIRFTQYRPKNGPLEGSQVTLFEPGSELRGVIKPTKLNPYLSEAPTSKTFQINPIEEITFKNPAGQPEKEFYSSYAARTQGKGSSYSALQKESVIGEVYLKQEATFDIAGFKTKKPTDFSKILLPPGYGGTQKAEKYIADVGINPGGREKLNLFIEKQELKMDIKKNFIQPDLSGPLATSFAKSQFPSGTRPGNLGFGNINNLVSFKESALLGVVTTPRNPIQINLFNAESKQKRVSARSTIFQVPSQKTSQRNQIVLINRQDIIPISGQGYKQNQLQNYGYKEIIGEKLITGTAQQFRTPQMQIQVPRTPTITEGFGRYPPFIIPKIPLFGAIGEGYLQHGGTGKQQNRYQASLLGLLSGKKGKQPKTLSGLEIRYPVGVSERLPGTRRKTRPLYLLSKGKAHPIIRGIAKQLLLKTRRKG